MMSGLGKPALALGLCLVIAGSVEAKQGRGGFGGRGGGGGAFLLSNKGVQEELKLTSEQTEKITKIAQSSMEKGQSEFAKIRDLPEDERPAKMQALTKTMTEELNKELKDALKPEQFKRFQQIALQQRGAQAFSDPEIQTKIGYTDEQKTKLKEILDNNNKEMQAIREANQGDFQAQMPKIQALRKETGEKALALLSADQKKSWKELTGEPYEVKFEPRPRQ
jgi:hypothetical protein